MAKEKNNLKFTWEMTPEELRQVEYEYNQKVFLSRIELYKKKISKVKNAKFEFRFNDDTDIKSLIDINGDYYNSMILKELEYREKIEALLTGCDFLSVEEKENIRSSYGLNEYFLEDDDVQIVLASRESNIFKRENNRKRN